MVDLGTDQFLNDCMAQAFTAAMTAARVAGAKQAQEITRVIEEGLRPSDRQQIHQTVGRMGQRSVLASYDALIGRGKGGAAGYRQGGAWPRYSGGKLRAALADESFFHATPDRLDFINVSKLNQRAKQWARLNFGAAPLGKGSQRSFSVQFGSMVVASLGLHEGPRPSFLIPAGYFWKNGQFQNPGSAKANPGAAFYLKSDKGGPAFAKGAAAAHREQGGGRRRFTKRQRSRGIAARNFLDAGVARVARELPLQYRNLVADMAKSGETAVRPRPVSINVRVTHKFPRSTPRT